MATANATWGWSKAKSDCIDGAAEISPSGRTLKGRHGLEEGEVRVSFHDHESGYRQVIVRSDAGCAVVLLYPGVPPITGSSESTKDARWEAKAEALRQGIDVKGLIR